jgi:hypothetical protein
MAVPIIVAIGAQLFRFAAPKVAKQFIKLAGGTARTITKVPKGKVPTNVNAGNASRIAKEIRAAKPKPKANTPGVTSSRNTQLTTPKTTSPRVRPNSGSKGTQVAKPKPKNTSVAKPRANSGSKKASDSKIVGINPKAFRGAATKVQLLGTALDSKDVTTKPVPASKPSKPSGPSKRPNNRPSPKVAPSGPSTRPNNKPTSGAMTLRTYLNSAIKKRGSTLSKEKAKGKNFKSIAAAKKGKSLYYMKGDTMMAAVYKEDLKK